MKRRGRLIFIIVAAALALCCARAETTALSEADAGDPVVVRVGDVTFTKRQLQSAVETDITLTEMMSHTYLTEDEKLSQISATVERFIGMGLIEMKLRDAGQGDFTPDEEETLKAAAQNRYEQIWQGIWERAQQSDEDFTEAQVTEFMQDQGYTAEAIFEELKASERRHRAVALFCPDLTLTADMVEDYYKTQFLEPDRKRYENDLDLYEEEVLGQGNEAFYTPEGYRAIQQVLIEYPDEISRGLTNETAHVNEAAQAVAEALQKVTEAAITGESWDDVAGPRADYEAAAAELTEARQDYAERRRALALPMIQDTLDAIDAAIGAGIDFTAIIEKYSADKNAQNLQKGGYPVHPDSRNWPAEMLEAVRALQKPGDISEPIFTDMGVHIFRYASDIPSGYHELTADERTTLNASALYYYQNAELEKLMLDWRNEYEIETHPELLDE